MCGLFISRLSFFFFFFFSFFVAVESGLFLVSNIYWLFW